MNQNQEQLIETIRSQILFIRDGGWTNMFSTWRVREIAEELDFPELVEYIRKKPNKYCKAIMTGKIEL